MPDTHAAIARRAAELITTNGWTQHEYYPPEQNSEQPTRRTMCLSGALNCAANGSPTKPDLDLDLALVRYLCPSPSGGLAQWNDEPERTKDEVVAALHNFADAQDGSDQL